MINISKSIHTLMADTHYNSKTNDIPDNGLLAIGYVFTEGLNVREVGLYNIFVYNSVNRISISIQSALSRSPYDVLVGT